MIVIACDIPEIEKVLIKVFEKFALHDQFCTLDSLEAKYATTAACWFPNFEKLQTLPNLQLIHSIAAGVEHLNLDVLAPHYHVCRVLDEHHQEGMLDYVLWGVLYFQRFFDLARQQQQQQFWKQYPQKYRRDIQVGIMGLGHMGGYVAQGLATLGYAVSGWSKSHKNLSNIDCYSGEEELPEFLAKSQIVINLLPLTHENRGLLNQSFFAQLPKGSALIHCGRGQHLIQQDLLHVLDTGQLRGAILDVFDDEPLVKEHPYWQHEKIVVTPHIASHAPMSVVVAQILQNDQALQQQLPLKHVVDRVKGY